MKYFIPKYNDGSTPEIVNNKNMTTVTFKKDGAFKLDADTNTFLVKYIIVGAGSSGYSGGEIRVGSILLDNQEIFNVTVGSNDNTIGGDSSIMSTIYKKRVISQGGSQTSEFPPRIIDGKTYGGNGGTGGKQLDFTPLGNGVGTTGKHIALGGKHIYSALGNRGTGAGGAGGNGAYKYKDINGNIQYIDGMPGQDAATNTGGAGGLGGAISDTEFAPSGQGGSGVVIISFPTDKLFVLQTEITNNIKPLFKITPLMNVNNNDLPIFLNNNDPPNLNNNDPLPILNTNDPPPILYMNDPIANMCFPSGTPITVDQGIVSIEKIDPHIHTIRNIPILGISKTISAEKTLVCFEANALGPMYPNQPTIMSMNHKVFYKGKLVNARYFVGHFSDKVKHVEYNGEPLYNVLLARYEPMSVNGLIVETLHPRNPLSKLFSKNI